MSLKKENVTATTASVDTYRSGVGASSTAFADHIYSDGVVVTATSLGNRKQTRGSRIFQMLQQRNEQENSLDTPPRCSDSPHDLVESGMQQYHNQVISNRRRSDHFQAYLAMSLHSVSNEAIKN